MTTIAHPICILAVVPLTLALAVPAMAGPTGSNETVTVSGGRTETVAQEDKTYVLTSVSHSGTTVVEPPAEEVRFVFHQIR